MSDYSTAVYSPNGSLIATQSPLGFYTTMIINGGRQRVYLVDANGGRSIILYEARGLALAAQYPLNVLTSFSFCQAG